MSVPGGPAEVAVQWYQLGPTQSNAHLPCQHCYAAMHSRPIAKRFQFQIAPISCSFASSILLLGRNVSVSLQEPDTCESMHAQQDTACVSIQSMDVLRSPTRSRAALIKAHTICSQFAIQCAPSATSSISVPPRRLAQTQLGLDMPS